MTMAISGELIRTEIKEVLNKTIETFKSDYHVIGIIGAQSSGKSTLLNKLFDTKFEVMDSQQRKQTTRGIWSEIIDSKKLIVLDIEGTDSRERGEQRNSFERRTALFGLALSNILIVNLWIYDIGRFSASNYEIIKTIFELNMQLFNQESPKKLVFVIRDWNVQHNAEQIRNILTTDMQKLWADIKRDEQQKLITFEHVFKCEFITVRSLAYDKENFDADTTHFREMLTNQHTSDYLFKDMNFKNVPIEDFYLYMSESWKTITESNDLNIPDQKTMISNFRCTEMRDETILEYRSKIEKLKIGLHDRTNFDISEEINTIMNDSIVRFVQKTKKYDDNISLSVRQNLTTTLGHDMVNTFRPLNEKFIKANLEEMERNLKKISSQTSSNVSNILQLIVQEKQEKVQKYRSYINKYQIEESKTREFKSYFEIELASKISKFLSSSTQVFCRKMIRAYITDIDQRISLTYINFTKESWDQFNLYCDDTLAKFSDEIESLKIQFEDVRYIFTDEIVDEFKNDLISTIKSILRNKKGFIFEYLIENFKRKFEIGTNGQVHMWRHLSDEEINELFKTSKTDFAELLKVFDKPILVNFDNEIILTIDDCHKIKKKFEAQLNDILEEVFNKKYNRNSLQKVPKWMWFVLAYFMHDNVLDWMRNPFFFLLMLSLVTTAGYLYFTNKIDYVMNWYSMIKTLLVNKIINATILQENNLQGDLNDEGRRTNLRTTNLLERSNSLYPNGASADEKDPISLEKGKTFK